MHVQHGQDRLLLTRRQTDTQEDGSSLTYKAQEEVVGLLALCRLSVGSQNVLLRDYRYLGGRCGDVGTQA